MALTVAVVNASVDGGTAVMAWGALHEDATAGSQVSNERVAITWGSAASGVAVSTAVPLAFTGTAAGRTELYFGVWDQDQPGGTFRGSVQLVGDQDFNASGNYSVTAVTYTGTDQTA